MTATIPSMDGDHPRVACNNFDTLRMEARLPENKLKKAIEGVARVLEKKGSTTHEELQSLVGLISFAAKVVYPG